MYINNKNMEKIKLLCPKCDNIKDLEKREGEYYCDLCGKLNKNAVENMNYDRLK